MKKSFYFALALTAGLFASCSSDDLTADAPQQPGIEVSENEAVQIKIGVGTPGTTRGTGSVGTTDIGATTTNTWQGQKFNLFMFKKGTFIPASYFDPETGKNVEVYNDTEMTTKRGQNLAVQLDENGVELFNYFPNSTTPYSFWAYRLDDAWVDGSGKAGWEDGADATTKVVDGVVAFTPGATTYSWDTTAEADATEKAEAIDKTAVDGWAPGEAVEGVANTWYKYMDGTDVKYAKCTAVNGSGSYGEDPTTVTAVEIPFKINGSQDIMIAQTQESAAATALIGKDAKTTSENVNDRIYTAYAARRGVYPDLKFKHQLARLYFEIKAFDRQVSEKADKKTTDANEYRGFKITGISVWSKNSGKLVAAYKGTDEPTRITWNDDVAELKIMQRAKTIEKADIKMVEVVGGGTQVVDIPEGYYTGTNNYFTRDESTVFYETAELDDKGMPKGKKLTNAEATAKGDASVWYAAAKQGSTHTDGTTTWDKYIEIYDDSLNLEPLEPITLKWGDDYAEATDGTLAWREMSTTDETTTYTWEKVASADVTPTMEALDAQDIRPTESTPGDVDDVIKYSKGGLTEYWKCTEVKKNTDGALTTYATLAELEAAAAADKEKIYKIDTKYYWWKSDGTAATEGTTVPTRIGESLLIAPSDAADGLKVKVYFKRCKKLTGTQVQEIPGESEFMVKSSDGAFKANSRYKVTAIMYQDGAAQPGNVSLEGEDDGETKDTEYDL